MDAPRWERLSRLFDAALDLPEAQQEAYIVENCTDDAELVGALRRMLAADAEAASGDFLETPMAALPPEQWRDETPQPADYAPGSRQFGAYRLLRLLGQGGMGEVHLAERADGAFEQRVALKLLPHPTPGLMQRFRQERQILAQLEHPNIARLLDGGVGEHNIPYFVMDFVDGQPINRHVQEARLDLDQTLELFLCVCDAVRYAHRNLVVHRDLKPSNILVSPGGEPKLLDFGIAKVLQTSGPNDATHTAARAFTPDYAAPEQIRGEPVTTATDVYALGVVLYELLAGQRPYRSGGRNASLEQSILQVEPAAPSSAITRTDADARRRKAALRGDLDRIVLMALAKEPERRYLSADALAADIRAYLDGKPVAARGDGALYRLRKFMRRNRAAAIATIAIFAALVAATGVSLWQAGIAREQAQAAETKNRTAEAVKDYLLSVFASANPYKTDGKVVTARDLLEGGLNEVGKKLADQPQVQAEIYTAFVETFVELDQLALADEAARSALAAYRQFLSDDSVEVLRAEQLQAQVQLWATRMDGLAERFEQLLARIGERGGGYAQLRGDVLALLAITYYRNGQLDQAATIGQAAIAQQRRLHAQYHYDTGLAIYQLALVRLAQGRAADVPPLLDEFVSNDRALVGPEHPGLITDVTVIGRYLNSIGRLREARELLNAAAAARLRQFDENHSFVIRTRALLYEVLFDQGETEEVEKFLAATIHRVLAAPKFAKDDLAALQLNHARALIALNRFDEARATLGQARQTLLHQNDDDAPVPLAIAALQADVDRRTGNAPAALSSLAHIVAVQRPRDDRELPASLLAYARAACAIGNPALAQESLQQASAVLVRQGRDTHVLAGEIETELAGLAAATDAATSAAAHLERAAAIACVNFGCDDARAQDLLRRAAAASAKPTSLSIVAARVAHSDVVSKPRGERLYATARDILAKAQAAPAAAAKP